MSAEHCRHLCRHYGPDIKDMSIGRMPAVGPLDLDPVPLDAKNLGGRAEPVASLHHLQFLYTGRPQGLDGGTDSIRHVVLCCAIAVFGTLDISAMCTATTAVSHAILLKGTLFHPERALPINHICV